MNGSFRPAPIWLLSLLLVIATVGCDAGRPSAVQNASTSNTAEPSNKQPASEEYWHAMFMKGQKIGYGQTIIERKADGNRQVVKTTAKVTMVVERFGERSEQAIETTSTETPDGQVIEFSAKASFGAQPVLTTGRVLGDQLLITTGAGEKAQIAQLPWTPKIRGFHAEEQTLRASPMQPGEQRRLRMLVPFANEIGDVTLRAKDYETVQLPGSTERLLRVESVNQLANQTRLESTYWVDESGRIHKGKLAQHEQYLVDKSVALDSQGLGAFDIGSDMVVPVKGRLSDPHGLESLRYRVTVDAGDPSKVFQASLTQRVEPIDSSVAEITTQRYRVGDDELPEIDPLLATDVPGDDDREPNSQVESDDPAIVKLASEARKGKSDSTGIAVALEKAVHNLVREKNFSQAFATAAETAKSREGDCTEHAVLLTAMLRASKIPARVAIGLVYVQELNGFGYHMWTEAFLDGHWVPLDATLGRGGIGPAHLKISSTNLAGASPYSSFLPVAQVLGRLKIEVIK